MGTAENQTENDANFTIFAAVGVGTVVLLIFIVLACLVPSYMKSQKSEKKKKGEVFHTDENHVYGTYSRGSIEDGEYGDGDVVEIIDTNVYYG